MMRISLRNSQKPEFLYSQENKREWETRIKYEPRPVISSTIAAAVEQYALAVFSALELRDTARIDFRVDKNNIPRVIDVNPLPGFSPRYSDLPILCRLNGISYSQMMKKIFFAALSRASENRDKG
jgi:D-alanine-D-alanine ligase